MRDPDQGQLADVGQGQLRPLRLQGSVRAYRPRTEVTSRSTTSGAISCSLRRRAHDVAIRSVVGQSRRQRTRVNDDHDPAAPSRQRPRAGPARRIEPLRGRRNSRDTTGWCARTCGATASPRNRRPPATTRRTPSAPWPLTSRSSCGRWVTRRSPWWATTAAPTSPTGRPSTILRRRPPGRHRRGADQGGSCPLRREIRALVVALVLPWPVGEAGRAAHLRRPRDLVQRVDGQRAGPCGSGEPRRLPHRHP